MESKNPQHMYIRLKIAQREWMIFLDANDNDYEDNKSNIPTRDKLTYKNGYYVDVTALFIDIVDSSKLTDGHKRPTLAKNV